MATQEISDMALELNSEAILSNPNVVYAAVMDDGEGDYLIEVGVLSLERVADDDSLQVPERIEVPGRLLSEGGEDASVRVNVVESDPVEFLYNDRKRPADGGNSIGNYRVNGAGTLGAAVTVSTLPNRLFIMTNWHVLKKNFGQRGDPVLQPARGDGGRYPNDWIANLTWWTVRNTVDLAIAEFRTPYNQYAKLGTRCYGPLTGAQYSLSIGDGVLKCGRTSNGTTGRVRSVNASINVDGRSFVRQIMTTAMGKPGDSGSLLQMSDGKVAGLLFAGNDSITYHNKISEVERALNSASFAPMDNGKPPTIEYFDVS